MPPTELLPDLLQRTCEPCDGVLVNTFANGLRVRTDQPDRQDPFRVLALGSPQDAILNHLVNFPEVARGRRVFEPFAGSGAFGFMALWCGARHADFLDISPRAVEFLHTNAALNGISGERYRAVQGDFGAFVPNTVYDLILANPPFVPTPDGIAGTITSNGGEDGNRFVRLLIDQLDVLLAADGEAFIYVYQIARDGLPLVLGLLDTIRERTVEITPAQRQPVPLQHYCTAYLRAHPNSAEAVRRWQTRLVEAHGEALTLSHHIVHIQPRVRGDAACMVVDNFCEKYGEGFTIRPDDADFVPVDGRRS